MTIVLARELHIVDDEGYRETYEEFWREGGDVEKLFYDRLQYNRHLVKATLVYRNAKQVLLLIKLNLSN